MPGRDVLLQAALLTDADRFAGTESHMLDLALGLCDAGVRARIACPARACQRFKVRAIQGFPRCLNNFLHRTAGASAQVEYLASASVQQVTQCEHMRFSQV